MDTQSIINRTVAYVQSALAGAEGGHDWWHINRVWNTANHIAQQEQRTIGQPIDLLTIELGALLHDIADAKFHAGDEEIGPQQAKAFMEQLEVPADTIAHVAQIIRYISFKGGNHRQAFRSPELDIVQDADRLDALGAIGIARAFNYGGFKKRALYNPGIYPKLDMTKEEYKHSTAPTINHFYEKLLRLKDRMNTTTGKKMAEARHQYMEAFLQQFYQEWEGKL